MDRRQQRTIGNVVWAPWWMLGPMVLLAVLFAVAPQVDIAVTSYVYDAVRGEFYWGQASWMDYVTAITGTASVVALLGLMLYWAWGKVRGRKSVQGRLVAYLFLAFLIGPVLTISLGFKEHWGRNRPIEVTQFGGEAQFSPYWKLTGSCESDCSFPSGHSSRGFIWVALAIAAYGLGWRYRGAILASTLAIGATAATLRVIEGKHFLSDVTLSGCIVIYVSWIVFRAMYPENRLPKP